MDAIEQALAMAMELQISDASPDIVHAKEVRVL
jgi:hypothetical protein